MLTLGVNTHLKEKGGWRLVRKWKFFGCHWSLTDWRTHVQTAKSSADQFLRNRCGALVYKIKHLFWWFQTYRVHISTDVSKITHQLRGLQKDSLSVFLTLKLSLSHTIWCLTHLFFTFTLTCSTNFSKLYPAYFTKNFFRVLGVSWLAVKMCENIHCRHLLFLSEHDKSQLRELSRPPRQHCVMSQRDSHSCFIFRQAQLWERKQFMKTRSIWPW